MNNEILLRRFWEKQVDCRFGQLLVGVLPISFRVINVPDDELFLAIKCRFECYDESWRSATLANIQERILERLFYHQRNSGRNIGQVVVAASKSGGYERYWLCYDLPDETLLHGLRNEHLSFDIYPDAEEWPMYQKEPL